jgi:uncharacterized coiled-coil protein SlyX
MPRRRSARHARPTGRGSNAAAYTALEVDVARLRSSTYADHLELIRLAAVVEGLGAQVQALTTELVAMRRELYAARSAPVVQDPQVEVLATQVAELRVTVATQQAMLADLTGRLFDLLERATPPSPAPGPAASSPPAPRAAHVDLATQDDDARPVLPRPDPAEGLDDETVLRLRLIRESFGR